MSPWKFESSAIREGEKTPDFDQWLRGDGLDPADAKDQVVVGLKVVRAAAPPPACGAE